MSSLFMNQLPGASLPPLPGDVLIITRDGLNAEQLTASDLFTLLSIASANGFGGTLAGGGTNPPVITLRTSVTGLLKGNGTGVSAAVAGTDYVSPSVLGAVNGVATLDSNGRLNFSQIPSALVGATVYQGTWDASTNTPALASGVGTNGFYYRVNVAGSTNLDGITQWEVGDDAIFNGSTWSKIQGSPTNVSSVNGLIGAVSIVNVTGTAASVTNAAQPTITSVGTLTGLNINGTFGLLNTTSPLTCNGSAGTTGQVLQSQGPGATPQWVTLGAGSGSVTNVSVVSANGFAGTVANPSSTPAITLTTSVSGMLKGLASALTAATAGTDYVAPGGALGTPSSGSLANCTGLPLTSGVSGILPVANGGTGTATPSLVQGTNVTITGTWPNQTINAAAGLTMVPVSGASQTASAGNHYVLNGPACAVAMPTTLTIGDPITISPNNGLLTNTVDFGAKTVRGSNNTTLTGVVTMDLGAPMQLVAISTTTWMWL